MSLLLLYRPVSASQNWYDTGPDPDQIPREQRVVMPEHFDHKIVPPFDPELITRELIRGRISADDEDVILLLAEYLEDFDA